jgi:hypothetical protein
MQDTLLSERQRGHRFALHKASTQNHPTHAGEATGRDAAAQQAGAHGPNEP